jgi:hypothetical protein
MTGVAQSCAPATRRHIGLWPRLLNPFVPTSSALKQSLELSSRSLVSNRELYNWRLQRTPDASLAGAAESPIR